MKVGSQTLSTNVYSSDRSGLLKEVQYGNDGKVKYAYDEYDRLTGVRYDDETTDRYTYEYGADGEASVVRDNNLGRVLQTERDLTQRAMGTQLRDTNGNLLYRTELDYDTQNRLVGFGETASGQNYKTAYTYDNDNRVTEISFGGNDKVHYTYDNLGRVSDCVVENGTDEGKLASAYEYVEGGYGDGSTTPLVQKINQPQIPFEYAYDSRGNIISEKRGNLTTTYAYDALGQLIRVNDPHENATWIYSYDRGGNILSKARYAYTIGELGTAAQVVPYAYGDANWKDKLTAYNGKSITYDAIGNPLTDGTWTYQWQAGRQLKQMAKSGTIIQFKYDHNGMRIQKVLQHDWHPETTNYIYHGKLLTHMTVDRVDSDGLEHSDEMHFFYDAQSRPAKIRFNGETYAYLENAKNDVIGILDASGTLVVEYKYDPWGRALSITGCLAATLGKWNPFRYRSYIYDSETEYYWLRDRYYIPEYSRFLNADSIYAEVGVLGSANRYAYCRNSPIILDDSNGERPSLSKLFWGIAVVATAVAAVAVTIATCGAAAPVLAGVGLATTTTVATSAAIVAEAALTTAVVATAVADLTETYENEPREYTVYCLADPITEEVQYVGRTKNLTKRLQAHDGPLSRTKGLHLAGSISNLTYAEARGFEEFGMAYYHTRKFLNEHGLNLIRGISLKNKKREIYRLAASRRCTYLYNRISNFYLCLREEL